MPEIVGTFARTSCGTNERIARVRRNSSRATYGGTLEFAVRQFDWIEVGRVFRQVAQRRVRFLNRLANGGLCGRGSYHHDDVVARSVGTSTARYRRGTSLQYGTSTHWGGDFVVAQGSNEGDHLRCSSGTVPITCRRSEHALTRQVCADAVSSINTNGWDQACLALGSSVGVLRHMARCRSAACRLFFKGDSVAMRKR